MRHNFLRQTLALLTVALTTVGASALDASHYVSNSVLSEGRWVKIKVNTSGIQQITAAQLQEWGFNDISKVRVYGFGGAVGSLEVLDETVPDDLPNQPVVITDDNRLLFYGESNNRPGLTYIEEKADEAVPMVQRTFEADGGYYFLTESEVRPVTPRVPYNPEGNTSNQRTTHFCVETFEEEILNPFETGPAYFGSDIVTNGPTSFSFPIHDYINSTRINCRLFLAANGQSLSFDVTYPSGSSSTTKSLKLKTPGSQSHYSTNTDQLASNYFWTTMSNPSAQRQLSFDVNIGLSASTSFTYGALEYFAISYQRKNTLRDIPAMLMLENNITKGTVIKVEGVTSKTHIWDVTDPYNVRIYNTAYMPSDGELFFTAPATFTNAPGARVMRTMAFDSTKQHNPVEFVGEIENSNIHSYPVPHLLIVSSDLCYPQAQRLADIHRTMLGQDVLVIRQSEIFNEFSSGAEATWGIRRMAKMFYDRDPEKLNSLLIFGGCCVDNRSLGSKSMAFRKQGALTLVYGNPDYSQMYTKTRSFPCDGYYGLVGDTHNNVNLFQNHMLINVGRIPALELSDAILAVDKVKDYLTNLPAADISHRILVVSDHGDGNDHMTNSEAIANTFHQHAQGATTIKGYSSLYEWEGGENFYLRNAIIRALQMGTGYFNYSGHANPKFMGSVNTWGIDHIKTVDHPFYPFAMLSTCDAYTFDTTPHGIAEAMLFKSAGGMIGIIASARTVYQGRNQTFNLEVAKAYARANASTLTGDIYRIARNNVVDNNKAVDDYLDLITNTNCYNFCGDPALPLYSADDRMEILSINGLDYASSASIAISPQGINTLSGRILVAGTNDTDTQYNGTVILGLYESPVTRRTYSRSTAEIATDIDTDEDMLLETTARVVNGEFTVTFTPPLQSRTGSFNRITLLAHDNNNANLVKGYTTKTNLNNLIPGSTTDKEGPEILSFYIDSPEFCSGDVVAGQFSFIGTIGQDPNGLLSSATSIGAYSRIVVDGKTVIPVLGASLKTDGSGTTDFNCPVTSMSDGRHEAVITVWDNIGNSNSSSIEFTVINRPATASLVVAETPARTEASFTVDHTFAGVPCGRLIIEDAMGNTVYTSSADTEFDASAPVTWNLKDNRGNTVDDGRYGAYAILKSGLQYAATPKIDVIVLK